VGTLRTDQVTLELRDGATVVRVTPLDPEVLRLMAPDARRRLGALAEARRRDLEMEGIGARDASLFVVSFGSAEDGRGFEPEALIVEAGAQRIRPRRIVPLTPGWGEQRLRPLAPESAIYLFDRSIPVLQPFTVRYGTEAGARWEDILPVLQAERRRLSISPSP
jgi:hypothetical protein